MYKIYINETPLLLTTIEEAKKFGQPSEKILILRYAGKKKFLLNIVNQLENSQRFEKVVIFHKDVSELWETFCKIFKIIEAAGGVVTNQEGEVLAIYRREFWDLPKGKIDPGETPEEASVREVTEETGLNNLTLGAHLVNTWHTYQHKGKRVLKKTYWYNMKTGQMELTPQKEEDIEIAEWKDIDKLIGTSEKIYRSILDVLKAASESKSHVEFEE